MAITIDAAGRMVIPLPIRRRLGLQAGSRLSIEEIDGGLVIRPVSNATIETAEDGLPVIRTSDDAPAMTRDDVRQLLEDGRQWPRRY